MRSDEVNPTRTVRRRDKILGRGRPDGSPCASHCHLVVFHFRLGIGDAGVPRRRIVTRPHLTHNATIYLSRTIVPESANCYRRYPIIRAVGHGSLVERYKANSGMSVLNFLFFYDGVLGKESVLYYTQYNTEHWQRHGCNENI